MATGIPLTKNEYGRAFARVVLRFTLAGTTPLVAFGPEIEILREDMRRVVVAVAPKPIAKIDLVVGRPTIRNVRERTVFQ